MSVDLLMFELLKQEGNNDLEITDFRTRLYLSNEFVPCYYFQFIAKEKAREQRYYMYQDNKWSRFL